MLTNKGKGISSGKKMNTEIMILWIVKKKLTEDLHKTFLGKCVLKWQLAFFVGKCVVMHTNHPSFTCTVWALRWHTPSSATRRTQGATGWLVSPPSLGRLLSRFPWKPFPAAWRPEGDWEQPAQSCKEQTVPDQPNCLPWWEDWPCGQWKSSGCCSYWP